MMYVLADGTATGEVHWPKDATRRMIEVSAGKEADIRAQISSDIKQMSTNLAKFPLSPEFLRNQLHNEMWAQMAEARIHNCQQLQQGQAAAAAPGQRPKKVGKRAAESFEVEEIITEKRSKFLVRWAGYVTHPLALPRARPNPRPPAPPHARRNYTCSRVASALGVALFTAGPRPCLLPPPVHNPHLLLPPPTGYL